MTSLLIVLLCLFVLASGFFSGSETALFSLSSMKVRAYRRHKEPTHRLIARLVSTPRELLVTILMLNVLVNILVQNIASALFADAVGWGLKVGLPLILTLLFGEIIPKTMALPNNERVANAVAPTIGFLHRFLGPVRRFISVVTTYVTRIMFFFLRREKEIGEEELLHALERSEEHGVLTHEETRLVRGYLEFQDVRVKELMRPRDEMIWFDTSSPIEELGALFKSREVTRVPVCDRDLDRVLGIVEARDYFLDREEVLARKQKPFFVPETMQARALFRKMEERNQHMAIAVDEYGAIAGLVTREDLVEVVVGEIADRRDERSLYTRASGDVIIASGKLELSELNDIFGSDLESSLVTVGGFLTEKMGELPQAGSRFMTDEFLFHVLAADPNRVRRVYIRRLQQEEL